jgi:hypothetical protein
VGIFFGGNMKILATIKINGQPKQVIGSTEYLTNAKVLSEVVAYCWFAGRVTAYRNQQYEIDNGEITIKVENFQEISQQEYLKLKTKTIMSLIDKKHIENFWNFRASWQ